jgi:periplasmic protein CpxP/Spy
MAMNKFRVVFYAALIFLAGALTGALVAPLVGRTFMRPPEPREMSRHMLMRLQSDLNLTEDQTAKIRPLIDKIGAEMDAIRRETTKRVHDRVAAMHAQIAQLLTPEQRDKFMKLEAEHRQRLGHRRGRGEPPPPPPDS